MAAKDDCNADDKHQRQRDDGTWENVNGDGNGNWRDLDRKKETVKGVQTCIYKWFRDFNTNDTEDWNLFCTPMEASYPVEVVGNAKTTDPNDQKHWEHNWT